MEGQLGKLPSKRANFGIGGLTIVICGTRLVGKVPSTGTWHDLVWNEFGQTGLEVGLHEVVLRPLGKLRGALLDLRTVRLVPIAE